MAVRCLRARLRQRFRHASPPRHRARLVCRSSESCIASRNDTQYSTLVILARKLFGLMALFCCVVTLAAPSTAQGAHFFAHAQAPVAHGEFHSHDDDEAVSGILVSEEAPAKAPDSSESKTGHSHMPSPAFDLSFLPPEQMAPSAIARGNRLAPANTPALSTLGWSPPVRPPRTA